MGVVFMGPMADAQLDRLAGIALGTALAFVFNYWTNRRFVFAG